jgi:MFS transporter, DHA3 family, macrolide efflux protein
MILKNTDADFIGRVNGILNPIFMGCMVITMTTSGWLKNTFSLVSMYETTAFLFVVGVLFLVPLFKGSTVLEKSKEA